MLSTLFKQEVKIRELEKIDSPLYHASNRFCNKIAKKLEKLTPIFENENLKAYEHDNTIIVHFTDETLAKHLYSHHSDLRPFSVYKLVFNKWHKKLSFLICPYTHSKNVYWLKPDFQDLCDCINNFLNSICTDTFKVNINYYIFFELSCRKHFYYTLCLLFSLTTDDYTMSKEELDKTIEAIVYDSHTSAYGVIASILDNGQDILPWLKNGVYPNKSYNLESPFNLPSYFVMNLLKRKFNPNYYTDSLKFFENEYIQGATDYDYMVLDEELFNSYLGSSSQEGDFIKYTAQDGLVFLTSPQSDRLERIYDILNEYNLLNHVSLACNALVRQKYLFYNPKQLSKPISLESYIDTHVKSRANAISLITQIYETLYIKDINLWFKNKEDMFNTLCIRPTSKKLFIDNLHLICLESKEDCVAFDPYFIIMKVLKLLNDKGIFTYEMLCESDLYKVIPFKFIKSLEEYLTTEVYNEPDSKDEYAFISTDFAKNIEFLENLDTKSETFVSRVSFVPNIEQNEHIKNILSAREIAFANATFNFNGVKPICLDELLYNAANMPLTTSSLKKFIPIRDKQHRFFGATKVIVSKDYTINGNYQIIGVVWPKLKPYNLFELISKKAINTKQIYKVMLNFARCPNQAVKLLGNEYSILLTRDLFPVINWLEVSSLDEPYSSNHDDVENYNCIFDIITKKCR